MEKNARSIRAVLAVDDDESILRGFERQQGRLGVRVVPATSVEDAIARARDEVFDLAIVDLILGSVTAIELIRTLKAMQPDLVVIVMTGFGSVQSTVAAMKANACSVVEKPTTLREILRAVDQPATPTFSLPTLANMQASYISRVLFVSNNNRSLTAKRLGILRQSLQKRLRKYSNKTSADISSG